MALTFYGSGFMSYFFPLNKVSLKHSYIDYCSAHTGGVRHEIILFALAFHCAGSKIGLWPFLSPAS